MPELPDVQVFKEYADATCLHQEIRGVHLRDVDRILEGVSASTLRRKLEGAAFESSRRHSKHLFLDTGKTGCLMLHFGMTGFLEYFQDQEGGKGPDHARLLLDFPEGYRMAFVNTRKLGEVGWTRDVASFVKERGLGPDALEVEPRELVEKLQGRRGSVKGALMNQELLAGLGNVYTDEILFQTGLHPETRAGHLKEETVKDLYRDMGRVLEKAIQGRVQEFPSDFLLPHRKEGADCPRCGGTIRKIRVSGRPTYFCDDHQVRKE